MTSIDSNHIHDIVNCLAIKIHQNKSSNTSYSVNKLSSLHLFNDNIYKSFIATSPNKYELSLFDDTKRKLTQKYVYKYINEIHENKIGNESNQSLYAQFVSTFLDILRKSNQSNNVRSICLFLVKFYDYHKY